MQNDDLGYGMLDKALQASNNFSYQKLFEHSTGLKRNYASAIGVAGEASFATQLTGEFSKMAYAHEIGGEFNPNQSGDERWDIKQTLTRHKTFGAIGAGVVQFNEFDGSVGPELQLGSNEGEKTQIYYQVKTLTYNSYITSSNITDGFNNAIRTAQQHPDGVSVLAIDQNAYNDFLKNADPG